MKPVAAGSGWDEAHRRQIWPSSSWSPLVTVRRPGCRRRRRPRRHPLVVVVVAAHSSSSSSLPPTRRRRGRPLVVGVVVVGVGAAATTTPGEERPHVEGSVDGGAETVRGEKRVSDGKE
uniref:Uncharacterized protein n=1 Tax=Oryza sativa subsp. japonica TaxID=39947 RepID=Q69UD4_ORYSJ|nr:hypothetical protein [Oryza sativa Japonica Group]BAD33135.1 hypothetical protein [Oryza sativa Japonica Group]